MDDDWRAVMIDALMRHIDYEILYYMLFADDVDLADDTERGHKN